jgi:GT2 family glycosyltransferase
MTVRPPDAARGFALDGKFFRRGHQRFHVKGVSYGPFPANAEGEPFPSPERARTDCEQIRRLGANLLRVYEIPPRWFLDLAAEHELGLLVDVPWDRQSCFLDRRSTQEQAKAAVRRAAEACAHHPARFALSVANEIPPDVVRWSGSARIERFIDALVSVAKEVDPEGLCTFGNFPTTEFLRPEAIDFHCFNVYLHHPRPFDQYLARLQTLAEGKPLILGETGIDSRREGETRQAEILGWQIELAFRNGLAGTILFSFTDEWFTGGTLIKDWAFGLTRSDREPKPAFETVRRHFALAPRYPLSSTPAVSVVIAAYNAASTLRTCLASLEELRYPDYEVVLVDDGSTDATRAIAADFPTVRLIVHPQNLGLSVARNSGIVASRGEIIAFTDADCRVDPDWLHHLVADLQRGDFAGIGGPNLLPPDDSCVASAVMVSPGGPAQVMLTERLAEHIPGCNMAFYRWALEDIGGFDPVFRRAGDDVDVCWRLQQRGLRLGFSFAGFVWHYRRSTVGAYLRQQYGYGEAEALLIRKHPEYFNAVGASVWRGRIYSSADFPFLGRRSLIYHGPLATGLFQTLYTATASHLLTFFTTLEFYVFGLLPLLVLAGAFGWFTNLAWLGLALPWSVCLIAAGQARIPVRHRRFWSRPLVGLLFWLQPLVRGYARYHGRLLLHRGRLAELENLDSLNQATAGRNLSQANYWSAGGLSRLPFLRSLIEELESQRWEYRIDSGWTPIDLEVYGSRWTKLQLVTVAEAHPEGRTLLRCRLRPASTLLAKAVLVLSGILALVTAGALGPDRWWSWLPLLLLPGFIAWKRFEQKRFQRVLLVFLDRLAARLDLVRVLGE